MSNLTAGASILSHIKTPKLKRQHLRKYSWLPDVLRVKGSILPRIFGPVLTITIFATLVAYAGSKGYQLIIANSIVPLLSVVVGLILVFRNGTSYDRYWEGRKAFAVMISNSRNLSRQFWINVAPPPTTDQLPHVNGKSPKSKITHADIRRRKVEAVRLTLAFAMAIKHYLREEDGLCWDDFDGLIPNSLAFYDIAGYGTLKSVSSSMLVTTEPAVIAQNLSKSGHSTPDRSKVDPTRRIRPKRSKARLSLQTSSTPLLARSLDFSNNISLPLPLVIAYELHRIIFQFRRDGYLETVGPAGTNAMTQLIQNMVDQLSVMERIANTPIPRSYGIHLKQCVTLYLFALPLTLVNDLGWGAIPIVTVVAFTFMGIEGIAEEIENPFGSDERDLPLERYCEDLREEIEFMIERLPDSGDGIHGYDDGEGDD